MEGRMQGSGKYRIFFRNLLVAGLVVLLEAGRSSGRPATAARGTENGAGRAGSAVRAQANPAGFALVAVVPDRMFTPNADGVNDYVSFRYSNPRDAIVKGRVYDLKGAFVSPLEHDGIRELLRWNGKNSANAPASGGVYFYQIEFSGSETGIITGTILLIR